MRWFVSARQKRVWARRLSVCRPGGLKPSCLFPRHQISSTGSLLRLKLLLVRLQLGEALAPRARVSDSQRENSPRLFLPIQQNTECVPPRLQEKHNSGVATSLFAAHLFPGMPPGEAPVVAVVGGSNMIIAERHKGLHHLVMLYLNSTFPRGPVQPVLGSWYFSRSLPRLE